MRGKEVSFNISGGKAESWMQFCQLASTNAETPDEPSFSRAIAPLGASLALPDYNPRFAHFFGGAIKPEASPGPVQALCFARDKARLRM
jgi:hypothetical protein